MRRIWYSENQHCVRQARARWPDEALPGEAGEFGALELSSLMGRAAAE